MRKTTEESVYFSNYSWCLNPILTFKDLLTRLVDETDHFSTYSQNWQQEESVVNLYLFTCAIDCTFTDYLSKRPWQLRPLAKRFPSLEKPILGMESTLNLPHEITTAIERRKLLKLHGEWKNIVEYVCQLLISKRGGDHPQIDLDYLETDIIQLCRESVKKIQSTKLPEKLLHARMKLNEGFRCQDLSPQDVFTLADRFLETHPDKDSHYVIIGSRTAGNYLAPLLKTYLEFRNVTDIDWITLRPKQGLSRFEKSKLNELIAPHTKVILIDDYANTGNTFHMLERIVWSIGVPSEHIIMMAPIHPVVIARQPKTHNYADFLTKSDKTTIIPLYQNDLYITQQMLPGKTEKLLKEFLSTEHYEQITLKENRDTQFANKELRSHYSDSFQVRLKRVYQLELKKRNGEKVFKKILAKSVGTGWYGYHAYLAGKSLSAYVPNVIGLRNGILFMEWLDGEPVTPDYISTDLIHRMSSYLAQRSKTLILNEDPRSDRAYLGWGWLEILSILRSIYHHLLGYLKYDALLGDLKQALHSKPILVDGRMRPEEWLITNQTADFPDHNRYFKVDFEHHNFGAPELDVVDPAYDLAITSFEFKLNEEQESELISGYIGESGDQQTLTERIFLYKLLYAKAETDRLHHRIKDIANKEELKSVINRIQWSWDFRVFTMNNFTASLLNNREYKTKNQGIFFLDIDGVFDTEILGFPHTTISGLKAISLLRSNDFMIIPNTGRSGLNVQNYCDNYDFEWGIGEYGSVIIDHTHQKEIPLVSTEGAQEISRLRNILQENQEIFIDSNYHYTIRAFRFKNSQNQGLSKKEAESILKEHELKNIRIITRNSDTYFVDKNCNKGTAVDYLKNYWDYTAESLFAVGDSDDDIPMLEKVSYAFAPRNCSDNLRKLSKRLSCRIVSQPKQRGLLQIARKASLIHNSNHEIQENTMSIFNTFDEQSLEYLMTKLLTIAEAPRYKRLISLFI